MELTVVKPFPRVLLAVSAVLLFLGGLLHAVAFNGALAVLSSASMPAFYSGSFKALWLIDSATLISLACLFAFIVVRPSVVTRWVLVLLALIPAATAIFIYTFVGPFFPAHMFIAAAVAVVAAGLKWRVG
jgi:hypothetical protein